MGEPTQQLSHFDEAGQASMVDVSGKQATLAHGHRLGLCRAVCRGAGGAARQSQRQSAGGGPLRRNPGGQAHLGPDSHVPSAGADARRRAGGGCRRRRAHPATAATTGPTGVEMEALTAAAVAALTVYDMTKALDKGIVIRRCSSKRNRAARAEISCDRCGRKTRSRDSLRARMPSSTPQGPKPASFWLDLCRC